MSDFETIARPYASAIFELANEQGALNQWSDWLDAAAQISSDADMQALITAPTMTSAELADLFLAVMDKAVSEAQPMTDETRNMVRLLAENDRLLALSDIQGGFEVHKQQAEGAVEVQVVSARKLTAKQEKAMAANLKKRLGKEVSISSEIDKSLIAGAIIRAGDLVIDGSARGRLNKLTSLLNHQ